MFKLVYQPALKTLWRTCLPAGSWIAKVKENPRLHIPVFGNGDVDSGASAKEMMDTYGADGVMMGRASIGYPWIFREVKHFLATGKEMAPPTLAERLAAAREHLERSIQWKNKVLGIFEMRRHYAHYFRGLENIKPFRMRLVQTMDEAEIYHILNESKFTTRIWKHPLQRQT